MNTRTYWSEALYRIAAPVLSALAAGELRARMPVESGEAADGQAASSWNPCTNDQLAHLQAFGRTLAGVSPWLELVGLSGAEAERQDEMRRWARAAVGRATHPESPDFLNFEDGPLPLCDAASLALGLLRGYHSVWEQLDPAVQERTVACLKNTRRINPCYNNWLLFSATVEAFLCRAGEDWDCMRVDYALRQHEQWYKGDGIYSDGPFFHWDYYNSYVIHPMLLAVIDAVDKTSGGTSPFREVFTQRAQRYAAILERLIGPDGSFPPIGRSLGYRTGAFHCLADMAWRRELPAELSPGQVRSGLTAVMRRTLDVDGTFDANGWLTVGLCGHQRSVGEDYMCTGALYLAAYILLPLGLPPEDAFWTAPEAEWTAKRIWSGGVAGRDHALQDVKHSWMGWT